MTRKHFEKIAAVLQALQPSRYVGVGKGYTAEWYQWRDHVVAMADMCEADNPLFKRSRFLQACGISTCHD